MNYTPDYYNDIETVKVESDSNGNPRYVVHWLDFLTEEERAQFGLNTHEELFQTALSRSREIGGQKYRAKWYGGGIVFQSYNICRTTEMINELVKDATK